MSDNVIAFPENFYYDIQDEGDTKVIHGVIWKRGDDELYIGRDGGVQTNTDSIPKNELKELMIMWLALEYPDVIEWDEDDG